MAPQAAHVGQGGEHPYRRGAKRDDAQGFDGVAHGAAREEIVGQFLAGAVNAFDLADLLDEEAQRRVDQVLVQARLAHRSGQRDISDFASHTGAKTHDRSHQSFRQRRQISLESCRSCSHVAELLGTGKSEPSARSSSWTWASISR